MTIDYRQFVGISQDSSKKLGIMAKMRRTTVENVIDDVIDKAYELPLEIKKVEDNDVGQSTNTIRPRTDIEGNEHTTDDSVQGSKGKTKK